MRILVVTTMYPTESMPHVGAFVAEQVRSLGAAGIQADLLFINPTKTRLNYALGLPSILRAVRTTRYDAIHTHHTYTVALVDIARTLTHRRVPLVLTNHEGEALARTQRAVGDLASRFARSVAVKRWMARRADFVVFVSRQLSDAIATNGRHEVIPCGVNMDKFQPIDRARCRAKLGIRADAIVLFFPASPTARGKRFELVDGAQKIIRRHHPHVQLLTGGAIPHSLMPMYYNAADVIVQSSFYEASPTIVKEALACEVPLVSTDSGDTREIIDGVRNCFVCADDPAEIASRVLMCVGHRAIGGRERLLAMGLSLEQVAQRLIRIYETIGE
jgi:teichuronic acid biosynthesis glycosyltransferase TuaC